jgi:hypothetical protein
MRPLHFSKHLSIAMDFHFVSPLCKRKLGSAVSVQLREVYAASLWENGGNADARLGAANRVAGTNQQDLGRINLLVSLVNTMAIPVVLADLLSRRCNQAMKYPARRWQQPKLSPKGICKLSVELSKL